MDAFGATGPVTTSEIFKVAPPLTTNLTGILLWLCNPKFFKVTVIAVAGFPHVLFNEVIALTPTSLRNASLEPMVGALEFLVKLSKSFVIPEIGVAFP